MAITVDTLQLDPDGWAVNAHTDDGSGSEEIQAAPGAGKNILLKEINITTGGADVVFLDSYESAGATAKRILGPLHIAAGTLSYVDKFISPIRITANENLEINTSGSTAVNIYASGEIK